MSSDAAENEVTRVLDRLASGERQATNDLVPLVYGQLHDIAKSALSKLPPGQTLQATALVHEAWLRVRRADDAGWEGREHFFSAAATAVREILIERARHKCTLKGDARRSSAVDPDRIIVSEDLYRGDVLVLDRALRRLEELRPRLGRLVSLRFFAGLTMQEIAESLETPLRTIERDWLYARAWLRERIQHGEDGREV